MLEKKEFDPYNELMELKRFAQAADTHISNLLQNEKQFITAINSVSDRLSALTKRIELMEKVLNEIARKK
jgi:lipopolysaccharide biosynthesis regulator YciM|tara:strand:- start:45 stop:254 length:210 start_codon:yes stop_codon:yes gene_type:complete